MASAAEQMAANMNWGAFGKAKELQQRILFALALLIVYRIGTYIPVPGIDAVQLKSFFEQANQGIGGMLNMFTGGAVGRMAIFALGIMPYITASIIIQLLTSMVPYLEQLKKEGEQGKKKNKPVHPLWNGRPSFFSVLWHSRWDRKSRVGVGSWDVFSSFLCDYLGWWNDVSNVAR